MPNNIIITLALNYTYNDLSVFLTSLNRTGFSGEVYLIVNRKITIHQFNYQFRLKQFVVENLKTDTVSYKVGFSELFKWYKRKKELNSLLHSLEATNYSDQAALFKFSKIYHCQLSRYALYLNILLQENFENVFLTDSRDVYFQSDPFKEMKSGLHIFQENINYKIKDRPYNKQWVRLSTTYLNYIKIRNKGIFCSGTILGDQRNVIKFLKTFLRTTLINNLPFEIKGIDQGLFNVLIHTGKLENLQQHTDQHHVLTLSTMDRSEYNFDDNLIYNAKGESPAVVHQYDRVADLINFIDEKLKS